MVTLKYVSNFWRTLERPLTNCEVDLILTWSADCALIYINIANQVPIFAITEVNLYVPAVTLSTQDSFKRTTSWNRYLSKPELLAQNWNLNHLVEPSFQGVNRLFTLAFENDAQRTRNKTYNLPNVKIKDYRKKIFWSASEK